MTTPSNTLNSSLSKLGTVEIQCCMHYLMTDEILKFARCSRSLQTDAANNYSFKHADLPMQIVYDGEQMPRLSGLVIKYHALSIQCSVDDYVNLYDSNREIPIRGVKLTLTQSYHDYDDKNALTEKLLADLIRNIRRDQLTYISIPLKVFSFNEVHAIHAAMGACKNLTDVTMQYHSLLGFDTIIKVVKNNKLKYFNLGHPDYRIKTIKEIDLCKLASALDGENCSLKYLNLDSAINKDTSISPMTDMLCKNTTITKLNISYIKLSVTAKTAISDMLKTNHTIIELILCNIGSEEGEGLGKIIEGLAANITIRRINLSQNKFAADDINALAACLETNHNYRFIKLYKTISTFEHAKFYLSAFKTNHSLEEFHLGLFEGVKTIRKEQTKIVQKIRKQVTEHNPGLLLICSF